ncbi:MAG: enoyl-CoA hydratase [Burkholderiales bacterium]|nr:enoyl-CoA hydratase [Burkholderiales bacterium]
MSILVSTQDAIMTIEFDRADKKNAITAAMYQTMADALAAAEKDSAVRAILIQGKPEVFTAGNDLSDFMNNPPSGSNTPVFQFLTNISHASKPIVAAAAGAAVGIGTTMLLHCDLVYAAESAKFSMPFASLGLCPEAASSLLLPALAGYQRAAEKLLLGEPFPAAEAQQMGLVNRVLPVGELQSYARARALALAAQPASSLRVTKALMKGVSLERMEAQMAREGGEFRRMLGSPEAKEAFSAFFERRKPDFSRFA